MPKLVEGECVARFYAATVHMAIDAALTLYTYRIYNRRVRA